MHEVDSVREPFLHLGRDMQCETCFASASRPGERHQPHIFSYKQVAQLNGLTLPIDHRAAFCGQWRAAWRLRSWLRLGHLRLLRALKALGQQQREVILNQFAKFFRRREALVGGAVVVANAAQQRLQLLLAVRRGRFDVDQLWLRSTEQILILKP